MSELNYGWFPIEMFRPETFPGNEPFLVWLVDAEGNGWWEAAQYGPDDAYADPGDPLETVGPAHITGEWRYEDETKHLEPVAYQAGPRGPHDEEGRS
jgi:hypothetical protein